MSLKIPSRETAWTAINIYLSRAYSGPVPNAVRQRLDQLRAADDQWYACSVLEKEKVAMPPQLALRLGNHFYPHMKLVIDGLPEGSGFLFRADSHDAHILPSPQSPDYAAFTALMRKNQEMTTVIETDWRAAGLPTALTYLEQDLAQRIQQIEAENLSHRIA